MTAVGTAVAAPSPWSARDRVLLAVVLAVGVAGLAAGYVGTSGTLRVSHQVVWVDVAAAALLVSGAGVVLFLTAGRRAVGRRRVRLFGDVLSGEAAARPATPAGSAAELVSAPTMTRYHRGDCSFVDGKAGLVSGTAAAHESIGRKPCGVCRPAGDS